MPGNWVVGGVASNIWDVNGDEEINFFFSQLFANYNMNDGRYLVTAPIITANWEAERDSNKWTIPVGGGAGRIFRVGSQPMNVSLQAYYNVAKPEVVGDWSTRIQVQWMFPR